MKKICIGTIFPNCNELCQKWLDLQLRYIRSSMDFEFDHTSVVQEGKITDFFRNNTHVLRPKKLKKNSIAHAIGLQTLQKYFLTQMNNYEYFLFIDMDAFPIRKNWLDTLTKKMKNSHKIAIVLRPENLEQRLHSSILFVKREEIPDLKWAVSKVGEGIDLIGNIENDLSLTSHQSGEKRKSVFTMIRSNKTQIHPLLCGVYYDMFYHHSCGSGRNFNMRARPYWDHMVERNFNVEKSINDLFNDPNKFIKQFDSWEKSEYVKI